MSRIAVFLFVFIGVASLAQAVDQSSPNADPVSRQALENYVRQSLAFTENRGQWNERALFRAETGGAAFFFSRSEVSYLFVRNSAGTEVSPLAEKRDISGKSERPLPAEEALLIKAKFIGANGAVEVRGEGRLPHDNNYFLGNDPELWRTHVPNYSAVVYRDLWQGIDLRYHGNGMGMKYDFIVNPGAEISQIMVRYEGVTDLSITTQGALEARTAFGTVYENIPLIYQEVDGALRRIAGHYVIYDEETFGFELEEVYNPGQALVIDPELVYSTYLGGAGGDQGRAIAIDGSGYAYVTGITGSTNFPTQNPYQIEPGDFNTDAFVTKFSLSGDSLIYSTYLGGNAADLGFGIAVDGSGSAFIVGATSSTNFPTQNPYQSDQRIGDAFVTKLSPSGDALAYSTYLGGFGTDEAFCVTVDSDGIAYVAGATTSDDFPIQNPYQTDQIGKDGFITKLTQSGDSLVYGTYLGGDSDDIVNGIAVDVFGNAYVIGNTSSTDFPVQNPYQDTLGDLWSDVFVSKLSQLGDSLIYSTYLGGDGADYGNGIAVDDNGSAHVTGGTWSTNFPTENPYQTDPDFFGDVFVTKFSSSGDSLVYSTYLGGASSEEGYSIVVDRQGNACVTGLTASANFPVVDPYQTDQVFNDAFITKLPPFGEAPSFSTYLGGGDDDFGYGIAIDTLGDVYIVGQTYSTNFPTLNPYQTDQGSTDVTVSKFALESGPPLCSYVPGDINGNGFANGIDVTYGVSYLKGGPVPPIDCGAPVGPCPQTSPFFAAGDVNGNCTFNGIDITFYVGYLKGNQPALLFCNDCPPSAKLLTSVDLIAQIWMLEMISNRFLENG
jgi:hypothetical protein